MSEDSFPIEELTDYRHHDSRPDYRPIGKVLRAGSRDHGMVENIPVPSRRIVQHTWIIVWHRSLSLTPVEILGSDSRAQDLSGRVTHISSRRSRSISDSLVAAATTVWIRRFILPSCGMVTEFDTDLMMVLFVRGGKRECNHPRSRYHRRHIYASISNESK